MINLWNYHICISSAVRSFCGCTHSLSLAFSLACPFILWLSSPVRPFHFLIARFIFCLSISFSYWRLAREPELRRRRNEFRSGSVEGRVRGRHTLQRLALQQKADRCPIFLQWLRGCAWACQQDEGV
jgi:hypothetical protein